MENGWKSSIWLACLAMACSDPLPPPTVLDLPPEATAQKPEWVALNADGSFAVTQTRTGDICVVAARAKGEHDALWKTETCVAERRQLRFVSQDGKALAVIDPSPEVDASGDAVLVTVWREGWALKPVKMRQLFGSRNKLQVENGRVWWLADKGDGFDVQAHDATITLTLTDGRQAAVFFSDGTLSLGQPVEAQPAAETARARPSKEAPAGCPRGPCTYVDGLGVFHMVNSPDEIPAAFRDRARPLAGGAGGSGQRY